MTDVVAKLRAEAERHSLACAIMHVMRWGTRGKDGKGPLEYKRMTDLDTDHLKAILANCRHIRGGDFESAIRTLLEMP